MRFEHFVFGSIRIDGRTYEHDVVIDLGAVRKRKKKASRPLPRHIRPHAAVDLGKDPVELPSSRGWDRSARSAPDRPGAEP